MYLLLSIHRFYLTTPIATTASTPFELSSFPLLLPLSLPLFLPWFLRFLTPTCTNRVTERI